VLNTVYQYNLAVLNFSDHPVGRAEDREWMHSKNVSDTSVSDHV